MKSRISHIYPNPRDTTLNLSKSLHKILSISACCPSNFSRSRNRALPAAVDRVLWIARNGSDALVSRPGGRELIFYTPCSIMSSSTGNATV